jgi:hypothetical protein
VTEVTVATAVEAVPVVYDLVAVAAAAELARVKALVARRAR